MAAMEVGNADDSCWRVRQRHTYDRRHMDPAIKYEALRVISAAL
jgi:hypothetical protein